MSSIKDEKLIDQTHNFVIKSQFDIFKNCILGPIFQYLKDIFDDLINNNHSKSEFFILKLLIDFERYVMIATKILNDKITISWKNIGTSFLENESFEILKDLLRMKSLFTLFSNKLDPNRFSNLKAYYRIFNVVSKILNIQQPNFTSHVLNIYRSHLKYYYKENKLLKFNDLYSDAYKMIEIASTEMDDKDAFLDLKKNVVTIIINYYVEEHIIKYATLNAAKKSNLLIFVDQEINSILDVVIKIEGPEFNLNDLLLDVNPIYKADIILKILCRKVLNDDFSSDLMTLEERQFWEKVSLQKLALSNSSNCLCSYFGVSYAKIVPNIPSYSLQS